MIRVDTPGVAEVAAPYVQSSFMGMRAARLLALLLVIGLVLSALNGLRPPDAAAAGALATAFSSERAMAHVKAVAGDPRPIGSPAHARARDYIIGALKGLGLNPQLQKTMALNQDRSPLLQVAGVENIIAEMSGSDSNKAILFVSHYDTVPNSPGANDDGVGVAAMLEMARALASAPRLKHGVILLFTDGEETGLLGARAFLDEHPMAKNVSAVINLEARGSGGPAVMFETGKGNRRLIREFASAAPKPVAHSFSYEIYKLLSNDTDFSVFKKAGFAGLNFAHIEGPLYYHNRLDRAEHVDGRVLQHHGETALALARRLADGDLQASEEGNAVYFDILGLYLVNYPQTAAIPLAALASFLFAAVLAAGIRRKRIGFKGLLYGFAGVLACMAISAGSASLVWQIARILRKEYQDFPQGEIYNAWFYLLGFITLTVALSLGLYNRLRRKVTAGGVLAGVLLALALPAVCTSIFLPGASYLFTWPLFFGAAALHLILSQRLSQAPSQVEDDSAPGRSFLALALTAVPGLLLFIPPAYLVLAAVPPAWAGAACALIALLTVIVAPSLDLLGVPGRQRLPRLLAGLSAALILVGGLTAGYDQDHPKPNNIFYALSADSGKAVWASYDPAPDQWTSQIFRAPERGPLSDYIPTSYQGFLKSAAPAAPLDPPAVDLVDQRQTEEGRVLQFRIRAVRQAPMMIIQGSSKSEWTRLSIGDRRINRRIGNRWVINYHAADGEAIPVTVVTRSTDPVTIRATGVSYELPRSEEITLSPRPQSMMPAGPYADATLVTKTFTF